MHVFKTRLWAYRERLSDNLLLKAIQEIDLGLLDADLGGHVYKKRIPLQGRGKRGGARTILAFRAKEKAFFIFGLVKNDKENFSPEELRIARVFAGELLGYSDSQLNKLVREGKLIEVDYEK